MRKIRRYIHLYVRTVGFRMWMVSPEASQFFMRKISRRSCCDWYNCVGFYVTDENTKIRAIAKEGVINRGISPICSCACRPKRRLSILTCRTCVTHESTHNNLVVVTRIMRTRCVMPAARGPALTAACVAARCVACHPNPPHNRAAFFLNQSK